MQAVASSPSRPVGSGVGYDVVVPESFEPGMTFQASLSQG